MLRLRNSLLTILLMAQVSFCLGNTSIDLTTTVSQQQQLLPQELSPNLLLTDINYDKQKKALSYVVTAIDTKPKEIDSSKIMESVCYKPQLRSAIKEGLTVSFSFYNIDKTPLDNIIITESSCQAYFKMQEILIQQDIEKFNTTILPEKINDNLSITKLSYQSADKIITANIQANIKNIDHPKIDEDILLNFTCSHYYFKPMLTKNIKIQYTTPLSKNLLITAQNCTTNTLNPLDNQLIKEVKEMKSNLKALSTDQIEIINIGYNLEKKQVWNKAVIKIPNITKDKLNPNLNIRAICATPSIRKVIKQGVSYSYSYYDMNNKLLMELNVNENTCKKTDQENSLLIKQTHQ